MDISFVKMHGLGNDFVMIDNMDRSLELSADQVSFLCDRHFGIGANGVIMVEPADDADGFMNYINSDGTYAQMCGNGVRCFAKFLVDNGYVSPDDRTLSASTRAGVKNIEFALDADSKLAKATVDMGSPILDPKLVPVDIEADSVTDSGIAYVGNTVLSSPWGDFSFCVVSMGNPHAVCFLDDMDSLPNGLFLDPSNKSLESLDVDAIGAFFESHSVFPEKTNVEFAVVDDKGISMRVYERGCGETLACGTGACATSVAATLTSRSPRRNDVFLRGGTLSIDWKDDDRVLMSGEAATSFEGIISIDSGMLS